MNVLYRGIVQTYQDNNEGVQSKIDNVQDSIKSLEEAQKTIIEVKSLLSRAHFKVEKTGMKFNTLMKVVGVLANCYDELTHQIKTIEASNRSKKSI